MGPVSATLPIDAPRERVHRLIGDLAFRPALTDHFIDEFRLERLDSAGVGAAARFRIRDRGLWVESVIAESEPPHRLVERGAGGRFNRRPVFCVWELVEAASRSGCEVRVTFVVEPASPFDRLADGAARLRGLEGWYRRQWSRALARLRPFAESDTEPPRLVVAGAERLVA
jgi:polyketide cyclase/dehydrase/lipid transport protein